MKKGKIFRFHIHCGDEYKFVLKLLNSLDATHENDLSLKITRDNQDEIKNSIFDKAINVDDKKEKYQFPPLFIQKTA